jgi:hypothetical protein
MRILFTAIKQKIGHRFTGKGEAVAFVYLVGAGED